MDVYVLVLNEYHEAIDEGESHTDRLGRWIEYLTMKYGKNIIIRILPAKY